MTPVQRVIYREARQRGVSPGEVINDAITAYIAKRSLRVINVETPVTTIKCTPAVAPGGKAL